MPASRPRRSTPRSPRRTRPGLPKLWRRPFGTRNRIVHLVRVGLDDDPEVPEFGREVLRVLDPPSLSRPPSSLPPLGPDESLRDLGPICIVVA